MSRSPQQEKAIKAVREWINDPTGNQVFRLFGYAGSGKTTLAKHLAEDVKGRVVYACFTGKAALVLRKKGCTGASTIHSLIYKPEQDQSTGETHFLINRDSIAATADLIVIDEVSMVGEELARDLMSFGVKILVLGDPAQLPPVKGEGYFINAEPDVMLTEVHRQAAENPIIRMSMDVREGRGLMPGWYGESRVVRRADIGKDELREIVLQSDQLLCGMNKTRQQFNERIRQIKGMGGVLRSFHPVPGDRLICLKNDSEKGLLNGGLWEAEHVEWQGGPAGILGLKVRSLDEDDQPPVEIVVPDSYFNGTDKDLDWRTKKLADQFTYGYAITVHKSQGSQWDNVLLFDESSVFRDNAANHLYTGLTRAAERVTIVV